MDAHVAFVPFGFVGCGVAPGDCVCLYSYWLLFPIKRRLRGCDDVGGLYTVLWAGGGEPAEKLINV